MKDNRGISMIEILVTLSIAFLIFAISSFGYREWQTRVQLTNSRDELKSVLLRIQQLATAAAGGTAWGLHIEDDHYVMFAGDYYEESNPSNKTWSLSGVQILNASSTFADGAGGFIPDTVFAKFSGETYNTGTISLSPLLNTSTIKIINVAESGQIY